MTINEYIQQGFQHYDKKEYSKAIENLQAAYEAAVKLNPNNPNNQGILDAINMAKQAESITKQASQAAENEAKHRAQSMGINIENIDQAIAEYTEALNRSPNDDSAKSNLAAAYYIRGVIFTSKGEHARSIEDYSNAIKYLPNYPLAINKRGQAYLNNGDFDKAIADFEELLRLDQNNNMAKNALAGAYMQRGIAHDKNKDYARAISDFEKSLQFNPDNPTTRELLQMAQAEKAKQ